MLGRTYRKHETTGLDAGFTLIEMLVVAAVAGVLMSVLLPALDSARRKSRDLVCAARLQQWGNALACYAGEYHGAYPHCDGLDRAPRHYSHPRISPEDLADWHGWADLLPPLLGLAPRRAFGRYAHPASDTFYQCPSAELTSGEGVYSYNPERDGYYSYAMNSCLMLDANAWTPEGYGDLPEEYQWRPMSSFLSTERIVWSSDVVVLFDQLLKPEAGFDGRGSYRGAGRHAGSYPKAFSARHGVGGRKSGGNLLYADGHVETRDSVWKSEWSGEMEVPPRTDRNWYPYPEWWRG